MAVFKPRSASGLRRVVGLAAAALVATFFYGSPSAFTSPGSAIRSGATFRAAAARSPSVAMQSAKVDEIVEDLKGLTLLEASELVKAIEETFGVDASAAGGAVMMAAAPAGGGEEEAAPAKTEFDVVLKEVPKDKKIAILKVVRNLTGMGLKEAKGMVDNPGKVVEGKPKDYCDDAVKQLQEAGAVCEIV
eukprot:TRINITY_DN6180_c0_g4_i1.p1 TRINITY_DN6180_c0_g4~~TRINITY_DN6180_c0_g4_i1.p1  ORF type:complete len:190 (-),score=72.40 TRINITY_DN6180_c0_g4_i1:144-713(-)